MIYGNSDSNLIIYIKKYLKINKEFYKKKIFNLIEREYVIFILLKYYIFQKYIYFNDLNM